MSPVRVRTESSGATPANGMPLTNGSSADVHPIPKRMNATRKLIALAICLLVGTAGGATLAAFSSQTSNSGNSFTAASTFPGQLRMATGSFIGNEADGRAITGLGFQPDVVIIKSGDESKVAVMRTSTMTGDAAKPLVGGTTLESNLIEGLTADGFTIGSDHDVNHSGHLIHWIAFKAADGVLKLGTYTGNTTPRSITGLGFSPEYVAVMAESSKVAVNRFQGMGSTFDLEDDKGGADRITSLDADGFSLGVSDTVNDGGTKVHYLAFNEVPGAIQAGSYTGDATDNRSIAGVGFNPGYVMVRADDTANNRKQVHRPRAQDDPSSSFFRNEGPLVTGIKSLESDGFQVGTHTGVNAPGASYHYMAFKNTTGCSLPGTQTLFASQDSWVEEDKPTSTHGGESALKVKSKPGQDRRALVEFALPSIPSGCSFVSATLRLNNKNTSAGRTIDLYRNAAPWTEAGVNWSNQPAVTGSAVSAVAPASNGWMSWPVSEEVEAMLAGDNYGFALRDSVEDDPLDEENQFDSREAGGNNPRLLVTLE